jgi:asparaginyl-tRNA synthetase
MYRLPRFIKTCSYSTKSLLPNKTIKGVLNGDASQVSVNGWIRSVRKQKQVAFATVNDGSTLKGIQAILDTDQAEA